MSLLRPITADELRRAAIVDITMTSPTDGWLVGCLYDADLRTRQAGLILRYHDHQWWLVDDPLPVALLTSIAMVTPTDGWVTGHNLSRNDQPQVESYLLRYTGDHWQPVAVPYHTLDGGGYVDSIKMLSPDEGWLVVTSKSSWRPPIWSLLLHYQHGTWAEVPVPIPLVYDYAPVGPDELWIVGNDTTLNRRDSTLAHYQQGQWTTMPAPDHAVLGTLCMPSAAAGYAIGHQPQPEGWRRGSPPPAVVLQYDGTTWSPIQTGADPEAQDIVIFDDSDLWAFVRPPTPTVWPFDPTSTTPPPFRANEVVAAVQRTVGRTGGDGSPWQWQALDWPFTDIISVHSMVRAAPGEYWAAAYYAVPPERIGDFHWGLLHFVEGVWQEYQPH